MPTSYDRLRLPLLFSFFAQFVPHQQRLLRGEQIAWRGLRRRRLLRAEAFLLVPLRAAGSCGEGNAKASLLKSALSGAATKHGWVQQRVGQRTHLLPTFLDCVDWIKMILIISH